jgi:hypothetical protein
MILTDQQRACASCPILILLTVPQRAVQIHARPLMDARTFAVALAATAFLPPNVSAI